MIGSDDLPLGLQIVGRWRDDATDPRAAAALERVAPWWDRRPEQRSGVADVTNPTRTF